MSAPAAQAFLNTLVQAKRYNLLGQIVREVNALLDARLGIIRAEISSAVPLTDALKLTPKVSFPPVMAARWPPYIIRTRPSSAA